MESGRLGPGGLCQADSHWHEVSQATICTVHPGLAVALGRRTPESPASDISISPRTESETEGVRWF